MYLIFYSFYLALEKLVPNLANMTNEDIARTENAFRKIKEAERVLEHPHVRILEALFSPAIAV